MAINRAVFKTRALTASLFVAIMLLGLLVNAWMFCLLFMVVYCGGLWEYFGITEKITMTSYHFLARVGFMILGFPVLAFVADKIPLINQYQIFGNTVYAFAVAGFLLASYGIFLSKQVSIRSGAFLLGGYAYLTVSIASLVYLASLPYHNSVNASWLPNGVVLPLFVIACMWINDTLAYIVGSLVGKTPLSKISPKKTWEGTIGGIILCGLVVGYGMHVFSSGALPISVYGWIILAALNGVTGTLGDLLESKFKRLANVKDSGTFMPGHGGFLDRFDSLLLAAPIFLFIYLRFT